jgi:hypothetical protein
MDGMAVVLKLDVGDEQLIQFRMPDAGCPIRLVMRRVRPSVTL